MSPGSGFVLPDGRELFADVSFRVGEGAKVALVGPNGAGKTTLLRMVAGDLPMQSGTVARSGGLGVMRQFIGMIGDDRTLAGSCSVAGRAVSAGGRGSGWPRPPPALDESEKSQLAYANALRTGVRSAATTRRCCSTPSRWRCWTSRGRTCSSGRCARSPAGSRSGSRWIFCCAARDEVLLLDEPDNFLDVPGKRWLEARLRESPKSVLYVSHDRELLAQTADRVVAVEGGSAWTHPGGFASWHEARANRHERLEENRRRWDEEHQKLRELMLMYKQKAAYNDGMASRYQAAQTRLRKFEEAGPPPLPPKEQSLRMNLRGGRTGKRAVMCNDLELENLTFPFDLEIWYGDRVAVLGANGTGKSHFLRLLAAGGTAPDADNKPVDGAPLAHVAHAGVGAAGRPGPARALLADARPAGAARSERWWRSCGAATTTGPGWTGPAR